MFIYTELQALDHGTTHTGEKRVFYPQKIIHVTGVPSQGLISEILNYIYDRRWVFHPQGTVYKIQNNSYRRKSFM